MCCKTSGNEHKEPSTMGILAHARPHTNYVPPLIPLVLTMRPVFSSPFSLSSRYHKLIALSKLSLLVTSYTRNAPTALR